MIVGIAASLFTAIYITHFIFDLLVVSKNTKTISI